MNSSDKLLHNLIVELFTWYLKCFFNLAFSMGKYSTKYSSEWVKTYNWLEKCPSDVSSAKCILCKCTFKISNAGLAQCRAHSKTQKHVEAEDIKSGKSSQITLTAMSVASLGKLLNMLKVFLSSQTYFQVDLYPMRTKF